MSGIWHGAWCADSTQQMVCDNDDDDDNSINSLHPCKGVTDTPFLSCFVSSLEAIYMLILFLPGGGSERKGARDPKPSAGRQLTQGGFPKVSWPPGFPSWPLGAPSLWLPGMSDRAGFSLEPGLVLFFFQVWRPGGWGSVWQLN